MLQIGETIGIIGGGQLGRMLAIAAARLGLKTVILDPAEDAPAFQCANDKIIAAYDDENALKQLDEICTVLTYEFENVPADALERALPTGRVAPNLKALRTSQDRLVEKQYFQSVGIETAPFHALETAGTLGLALEQVGGAGIVKTRRFGYDGKGQVRVSSADESSLQAGAELAAAQPCILEGLVPFIHEISVIGARSSTGEIACFDPAENVHREGILRTSTVPANVSPQIIQKAKDATSTLLEQLDYCGVIGVEFFITVKGELIANEFAPRVHNSGHWTEAACAVSQFEQHIRAIAGWPLGATTRHSDCVMENLIGDEIAKLAALASEPQVHVHHYGKTETRVGRKMGHFTRLIGR